MKKIMVTFLVVTSLFLFGCASEPVTLDTTSEATISTSIDAMLEQLNDEEKTVFKSSITNCYMILGMKHFGETEDPKFAANQKMGGMTVDQINNLAKELLD